MFKSFALGLVGVSVAERLSVSKQLGDDRVVRMTHDGVARPELREILGEIDIWGTQPDGALDARVAPTMKSVLSKFGFNVTDVTEEVTTHLDWMSNEENLQHCHGDHCASADDFYTQYQDRTALNARFQTYQNAERFSIGSSTLGVETFGWSFGAGDKPVVLYFCGTHAREWLPPMFCSWMGEQINAGMETKDATVMKMLEDFDFHIIPVLNPDGYDYSRTTANMWRKNRNVNQGSTCIGTDLNRNYPFQWNTGGSSSNPCSETFHGATPGSTAELTNLMNYYSGIHVAIQVDVHAYGQMWMHPWGWTRDRSADDGEQHKCGDATRDAIRGVNGLTFATGSIANVIYVASGSSCDYFYGSEGTIYAYAPEVRGTSFQPAASNIVPSNAELWAGMIAGVECAQQSLQSK